MALPGEHKTVQARNHGKLWKSLMRAHLGAYEAHEDELKRIGHVI